MFDCRYNRRLLIRVTFSEGPNSFKNLRSLVACENIITTPNLIPSEISHGSGSDNTGANYLTSWMCFQSVCRHNAKIVATSFQSSKEV